MTFASLEFALFLSVTFACYWALPQRGRMLLLLAASYVFYAFWNAYYAVFILASTVIDYSAALAIARTSSPKLRVLALLFSVVGNLGMLGYFKYTDFALDSLRSLLGPLGENMPGPLGLILPVGISFYTFQTMSYTIDVYRGQKRAERDFLLVALYVSFFPQLVAGPIERAGKLMPQLRAHRRFSMRNVEQGGRLILWGLIKKVVVADRLILAAYPAFARPGVFTTGELAFSAVGMTIALYLDFSAYSEIARGTAQLFGVRLIRNFEYPFATANIVDYWRRWHISMSNWVQDYLYRPLGGFRRRGWWAQARILLMTMGLVGLWHGAQWTFVLWGLAQGFFLIAYLTLRLRLGRKRRRRSGAMWSLAGWTATRFLNVAVCVLFFAPDLPAALAFYRHLYLRPAFTGFEQPLVVFGFLAFSAFWILHYAQSRTDMAAKLDASSPLVRGVAYAVCTYVLMFGAVDQAEPFIYYQF
jgi:D-alanyl-lipoteichoic acid acyltransferase DltB (MBOAT superfamily)